MAAAVQIEQFLNEVIAKHQAGDATEHTYRPALANLFESIDRTVSVTNEAKRVTDVGSPDFTFRRKDRSGGYRTIGHCEAKDVGFDVRDPSGYSKEQKERYLDAFPNLLYTNGIDWIFYRDHSKKPVAEVRIAEPAELTPLRENFEVLEALLKEFVDQKPQSIITSNDLAEKMAAKAKLIRFVFNNALNDDPEYRTELGGQFKVFQKELIHDITTEDFVGIYAETVAYGLFAARLNDPTPQDFSRQEAYDLLPRSIPFLRNLFQFIARSDLDPGLARVVDDLVEIFAVSDVFSIMESYGKSTARNDPFLHFYEDFLSAYDAEKKKVRGVWYTPEPVVDFIVRAVDDVLKTEFNFPTGLADTSKTTIKLEQQTGLTKRGKKSKRNEFVEKEIHKIQILDPAAGTGTFLAHAIKKIAVTVQGIAPGGWPAYVEDELIPRLHGFELLMASYAMCHLKFDMELKATGYKPTNKQPRASIYLTNSLEEGQPTELELPFAQWLADEARAANEIKSERPIMCVIGNPPYLGEGGVSDGWLGDLLADYKKEPGGRDKLNERNPKWLNDLYVKFIRMAEHLIDRNGEGVLGFITNHGYLDNPTFRGMRWHLLKTFDKIYVLDLHGNAKKKEVAPDGGSDKNVFDIQQGVAIIIAIKTQPSVKADVRSNGKNVPLAKVFHGDLWGDRKSKYEKLWTSDLKSFDWAELELRGPRFPFVVRNWELQEEYLKGFSVREFFNFGVLGFQTHRDKFAVDFDRSEIVRRLEDLNNLSLADSDLIAKYGLRENKEWKLASARKKAQTTNADEIVARCAYRPFDNRWCLLDELAMDRPRPELNQHVGGKENIVLLVSRQLAFPGYRHAFVVSGPAESCVISTKTKEQNNNFPLYLYPEEGSLDTSRQVNFDPKLYKKLRKSAAHPIRGEPTELEIFDYIYGILNTPSYRETYAEFLKVDFPHVPWPVDPDYFWHVSDQGNRLRRLHLLETDVVGETPYPLKGDGNNVVADKYPKFELRDDGKGLIYINEIQYFLGVPRVSWGFWVGGYQPAQKWLKDRRRRTLSFEDIQHYQRILKALSESDRVMSEI